VIVNGMLAAYISRGARQLTVFLPEDDPARSIVARALSARLANLTRPDDSRMALLIGEINGIPASEHPLADYLIEAGFSPSAMGFQMRRHA
jgi:ATP-dependent Lhr-like helicase